MMRMSRLVSEGWHKFQVVKRAKITDKNGNPIYRFYLKCQEPGFENFQTWFQVNPAHPQFSEKFISSTNVEANEQGEVDLDQVGGKVIYAKIERRVTVEPKTALQAVDFVSIDDFASQGSATVEDELDFEVA